MTQNSSASSPRSKDWPFALAALGIVFGDIGTSPLYALREAFHGTHAIPLTEASLYGVLSLIFWSLTAIISFWYLQFVMRADNHGEGGVLALTALACLHKTRKIKKGNTYFLILGLFGAALLVGDGMITPAISVMSAVEGLKVATPIFDRFVVPLSLIILVGIFSVQKFGTAKIGSYFGPVMLVWFSLLAILGINSIVRTPEILMAASPHYALLFIIENPKLAFVALGAVFLVVTGGESLYTDLGHFGRKVISQAWFKIAMPALIINYFGQGALLLRDPSSAQNPFYLLVPDWGIIPMVLVATCAAIIASQALISGLFSMSRQCVQLGFCPRLEILHTSAKEIGQIYVPPMNWILMIGTIWLVIAFESSGNLASAYGVAVALTMLITSILALVVARALWHWKWRRLLFYASVIPLIEIFYFAANSLKIADGGWVPLLIAACVYTLMTTWNKGRKMLMRQMRERAYPFANLIEDLKKAPPALVSGCAVYMVGDAKTTPPALMHNLKHNKVLHKTVIFLTVVTEDVSKVPENERLDVETIAPGFFRVIGKYGFMETPDVSLLLNRCQTKGFIESDDEEPTYFLGREILVSRHGGELSFWRKKIFSFLAKNSRPANAYFNLPLDRVIEVGMQVEI